MIDLSCLDALKVPTEEVEVNILGKKQKVTVSAFGDVGFVEIGEMKKNDPNKYEVKLRKFILMKCCGMTEEQADKLMFFDGDAALDLVDKGIQLSNAFDDERKRMREQAEKNSATAGAVTNA